jgi:hypothetical protein
VVGRDKLQLGTALSHHLIGDGMTGYTANTNTSRWESVMENFVAAKEAADAIAHLADCDATSRIDDLLDDVRQSVFSTAAPDLGALAEKLEVYWGEELFAEDDYVASYKATIVGDIRRIRLLNLGIDNEDASGGMDLERVAAQWADALQEYNLHAQFIEAGPSDRWKYSKKSDLVALKDDAEAKLLSLYAPNLAAVIRKLELLWSGDDRFDPSFEAADQGRILRDLHRLESQMVS